MPSPATTSDVSGAVIVARVIAEMDASGQAALTTLQKVTVSVSYDDLYEHTLSFQDSAKLCKAFTISGAVENGVTVGGDNFAATLSNATDFEAVLASNMEVALCKEYSSNDDISGSDALVGLNLTLKQTLYNGMLNKFKRVFADSLPNLLESDWSLSNQVDYAGGAANMRELIVAAEAEIIAQQIPESNYALYMDGSENATTTALPLKHGDSIVFVFHVNEAGVSRVNSRTYGSYEDANAVAVPASGTAPGAGAGTSSGAAAGGAYGATQQAVSYILNDRTVAFKFTVVKNPANTTNAKLHQLELA
jgi:azurin